MKTDNRKLTYKVWLDELKTSPPNAFFPTLKQYLNLLVTENPSKIKVLESKILEDKKRLARFRNKTVKELERLLKTMQAEAKKEKITSLPGVDKYEQIKRGEIITTESLPDALYHALRLTIEEHWKNGKFKRFESLMSVRDSFWYFDYDKVSKKYPSYKQLKKIEEIHEDEYKSEPWGAFRYLLFALSFFKKVTPEQAGSFVKPEIISCLRRLILYLLTPEDQEKQIKGQKILYSFNKKAAVLKIGNKEIPFTKEKRRIQFLGLLIQNSGYTYLSEAAEDLEGASQEALKNAKNTYYEVCRGIEARLLKKGVSDFLDYDYNRVRVNPRYKKTSS